MPAPDNRDTTPAGCSAGADTGAPAEDPAAPAEDDEFSFFVLRRVKESERRTLDMAPKTVTLEAVFSCTRECARFLERAPSSAPIRFEAPSSRMREDGINSEDTHCVWSPGRWSRKSF